MRLTASAIRRNSPSNGRPSTSTAILRERSPVATESMTRAVSLIGWVRQSSKAFKEPIRSAQAPAACPNERRSWIFPSFPTRRLIRLTSSVERARVSATSLKVVATVPAGPVKPPGRRTSKSPRLRALSAAMMCSIGKRLSIGPLAANLTVGALTWRGAATGNSVDEVTGTEVARSMEGTAGVLSVRDRWPGVIKVVLLAVPRYMEPVTRGARLSLLIAHFSGPVRTDLMGSLPARKPSNPKGIASSSSGLRGMSYPGWDDG